MSSPFQFWLEESCLLSAAVFAHYKQPTKLDPNLPNFSMIAMFSKI